MNNSFINAFWASVAFLLLTVSLSHADKAWDQYLALNPSQRVQYKGAEQSRKGAIDPAKQDKDGATQTLMSQVLANAGDSSVLGTTSQILGDIKTIDGAEEVFWRSISGFLAPTQVAKIFLKWHQPKNAQAPPAAPKMPMPNPAPKFDWNGYFGFTKDLQTQLKAADQAKNTQMKTDRDNQESSLGQLAQQVQSNAGDGPIQMTLTSIFSIIEDEHHVEQAFWGTTLPGFLSPTQLAKLYLHRHAPKGGFNPPAQGGPFRLLTH